MAAGRPPGAALSIQPGEHPTRDRTRHAKDPHPSDEALEHRTELDRQAVGSDDANPFGADEHPATDCVAVPRPPPGRKRLLGVHDERVPGRPGTGLAAGVGRAGGRAPVSAPSVR